MPVKRRKSKARPDEARAWLGFMECGRDYFDDLVDAGIVAAGEEPSRKLAQDTWRRIGDDILMELDRMYVGFRPPERPIYAEREFGAPRGRRKRPGA